MPSTHIALALTFCFCSTTIVSHGGAQHGLDLDLGVSRCGFGGSEVEFGTLKRTGFVVTSQALKQPFVAYGPKEQLPFFVTTDIVLTTYARLLRDAAHELDRRASPVLEATLATLIERLILADSVAAKDAARLLAVAHALVATGPPDVVKHASFYVAAKDVAEQVRCGTGASDPVIEFRSDTPFLSSSYPDDLKPYFQARLRSDNYSWALTTIRSVHPGTAG